MKNRNIGHISNNLENKSINNKLLSGIT